MNRKKKIHRFLGKGKGEKNALHFEIKKEPDSKKDDSKIMSSGIEEEFPIDGTSWTSREEVVGIFFSYKVEFLNSDFKYYPDYIDNPSYSYQGSWSQSGDLITCEHTENKQKMVNQFRTQIEIVEENGIKKEQQQLIHFSRKQFNDSGQAISNKDMNRVYLVDK